MVFAALKACLQVNTEERVVQYLKRAYEKVRDGRQLSTALKQVTVLRWRDRVPAFICFGWELIVNS